MVAVDFLLPVTRGDESSKAAPLVTRDELIHLAQEGGKTGAFTPEEARMISGVFELKAISCADVMVPRDQFAYVHHNTSADDICLFARAQKVNQFPVFHKERQTFTGVVYIFDVLADENPKGKTAENYMRPPQLVSGDTPVDHILPRMRVTRQPIVLVTDEKYAVIGMVTLEDAVEEIVGHL